MLVKNIWVMGKAWGRREGMRTGVRAGGGAVVAAISCGLREFEVDWT